MIEKLKDINTETEEGKLLYWILENTVGTTPEQILYIANSIVCKKPKPRIIGITGNAGAGKDTVANIICDILSLDYAFKITRFAEPLKRIVSSLTNCDVINLEKEDFKNSKSPIGNLTYRKLLQTIGTDFGRKLDKDIWINYLAKATKSWLAFEHNILIIPDVRFKNEAEWIRNNGGIIIEKKGLKKSTCKHVSETEMKKIKADYTIPSYVIIEDLEEDVKQLISKLY